jgi:hypothetical protein
MIISLDTQSGSIEFLLDEHEYSMEINRPFDAAGYVTITPTVIGPNNVVINFNAPLETIPQETGPDQSLQKTEVQQEQSFEIDLGFLALPIALILILASIFVAGMYFSRES